jgi:hypothetical protein
LVAGCLLAIDSAYSPEVVAAHPCVAADSPECLESMKTREQVLLPDLVALPAYDLRLQVNYYTGQRILRFSNSYVNIGAGPVELRGEFLPGEREMKVTQYLYSSGETIERNDVGELGFKTSHDHWHWLNFTEYEIWSVNLLGGLETVLLSSGKVGYCLADMDPIDADWLERNEVGLLEIPNRAQYTNCGWRVQGISPGWVDTYRWNTPGQLLDVTGLEDGTYALRTTVDPDGVLEEADPENNDSVVYFTIEGTQVERVEQEDVFLVLLPFMIEDYGAPPPGPARGDLDVHPGHEWLPEKPVPLQ